MPLAPMTNVPPLRVAAGLGLVGSLFFAVAIGREPVLARIGTLTMLVAAMIYCTHRLMGEIRHVNRPADDAFTEGYEAGYDRGWRDGNDAPQRNLVLLPSLSASAEIADTCGTESHIPASRASNHGGLS